MKHRTANLALGTVVLEMNTIGQGGPTDGA
jgi:hypothetical protein